MAGRVFLRGKTYHIALSYKGVEYRKSALTDKKREAENLLAYYLGQCARGDFHGFEDTATLTIGEMLTDHVDDAKRRQLRDLTTLTVKVKPMQREWGTLPAANLTERHIDLYIKQRAAEGRSHPRARVVGHRRAARRAARGLRHCHGCPRRRRRARRPPH